MTMTGNWRMYWKKFVSVKSLASQNRCFIVWTYAVNGYIPLFFCRVDAAKAAFFCWCKDGSFFRIKLLLVFPLCLPRLLPLFLHQGICRSCLQRRRRKNAFVRSSRLYDRQCRGWVPAFLSNGRSMALRIVLAWLSPFFSAIGDGTHCLVHFPSFFWMLTVKAKYFLDICWAEVVLFSIIISGWEARNMEANRARYINDAWG